MRPDRIEFNLGETRFRQRVKLIGARGSDGSFAWTLYRAEADQRDNSQRVDNLSDEVLSKIVEAVQWAAANG